MYLASPVQFFMYLATPALFGVGSEKYKLINQTARVENS